MRVLLALLLLSGCTTSGPSKPTPDPSADVSAPRFDGLYQSEQVEQAEQAESYHYYLRFYADGTVITVSSTGTPAQLERWFDREKADLSRGQFTVTAGQIAFSATSDTGTVNYEGRISADRLELASHSEINGNRQTHVFAFVPFAGSP